MLDPLLRNNQTFFTSGHNHVSPRALLREMKIFLSKLLTLLEVLPYVITFDKHDLFSLDPTNQAWMVIKQFVQFKVLGEREALRKSYAQVIRGIVLGSALVAKQAEYKSDLMRSVMFGVGGLYYLINSTEASRQSKQFQAEPQAELAFQVWNMLDKSVMRHVLPVVFPPIKYKESFFVPRYFKPITIQYVLDQYENYTINKLLDHDNAFIPEVTNDIDARIETQPDPSARTLHAHPRPDPGAPPLQPGGTEGEGTCVVLFCRLVPGQPR